jgi:hypothetical protein
MYKPTKYISLTKEELQSRIESGATDPQLIQEALNRYLRGEPR